MAVPRDIEFKAGDKIRAKHKGTVYIAEVSMGEDGKPRFKLPDDATEYKSLSSVGTGVTQGAVNGWNFWSVDDGSDPNAEKPKAEKATRTRKKKDADATDGADAVSGAAIPKEVFEKRRQAREDAAAEGGDDGEPGEPGEDENSAKIECQECSLEFPNAVEASEHFNTVHVA